MGGCMAAYSTARQPATNKIRWNSDFRLVTERRQIDYNYPATIQRVMGA